MKAFMIKIVTIAISLISLCITAYAKNSQNWTGFYVGPEIGLIFNNANLNAHHLGFTNPSGACNGSADFSSFFPGLQVGYAQEFASKFVLGVEGNFTYNFNQTGTLHCTCPTNPAVSDRLSMKNRLQTSIRGRIGYAINERMLPFFIAGASFADLKLNYSNEGGNYYSTNATKAGWLVGGGFEWLFSKEWSLSIEYFYTAYSALDVRIPTVYGLFDPRGDANLNLNTNNIAVALNYWFW